MQFWPAAPEAPRRLLRSEPAVARGDSGWQHVFGWEAAELTFALTERGATIEEIDDWGRQHQRAPGWIDEPLWRVADAPLPTGHAGLDEERRAERAALQADVARRYADLAEVAAQLGVPAPTTRRQLIPVLGAAGMLSVDHELRYRVAPDPPHAIDVLTLPPDRSQALGLADAHRRYTSFASDILSTVLWTLPRPAVVTVAALADRLLAAPDEVRRTLRFAMREKLLDVEGEFDGEITLTVGPGRAPAEQPAPPIPVVEVSTSAPTGQDLPVGPPPCAGFITAEGAVTVWRDGAPTVLARVPPTSHGQRAIESAFGILVNTLTLVRFDGRVEHLDHELTGHMEVSEDGRLLAVAESDDGRRARTRLSLIDLADGSHQRMPWRQHDDLRLLAVRGGTVYFAGEPVGGLTPGFRWEPGSAPEPLGHPILQVDRASGTMLGVDHDGLTVTRADGTRKRGVIDDIVRMAPGGQRLFATRYAPPLIAVFDIDDIAAGPVLYSLPEDLSMAKAVWEDQHHLIIPVEQSWFFRAGFAAVRLDVRTGALDRPAGLDRGGVVVEAVSGK